MRKKCVLISIFFIILVMTVSVITLPCHAEGQTGSGLKYALQTDMETGNSYAVITGGTPVKDLVIPADINGYPVREVASGFASSDKGWPEVLETLTIEEGIEVIGDGAFTHCTMLGQISFPESLCSVGEMAFVNVAAKGLELPENAKKGSSSFWYCSGIQKDEKGEWEYGLLSDGTAVITSLFIQSNKVLIPDKIDGIPVSAVARVPVTKVDYQAIHAIKTIKLPKNLKAIEHEAFQGCINVKTIEIPKSLISIGYAAFKGCTQLKGVTIPAGVTKIGREAFCDCTKLVFPSLPSGLETIERRTFYQCGALEKVKLPASVRTVGEQAFARCRITSLALNDGLETIEREAFSVHKLKEIALPSSLKSIGDAAFDPGGNNTLRKITFNGIATKTGIGVFGYNDGWDAYRKKVKNDSQEIKNYDKNDPNNWIDYYRDNVNYGQNTLTMICSPGSPADQMYQYHVTKVYPKRSADAVNAPSDRILHAGLYTNEDMIYELIIPDGVEELEDYAFAGLSTLNKITLPATLSRIGAHAFEGCTGLTEIIINAKTMAGIGEASFYGCTQLKNITIPEGITQIGESTFEGCTNLQKVTIPKKGFLSIGNRAFAKCSSLSSLNLPNGLESIGKEAFSGCGISYITVPDSVTFIGEKAFYLSGIKSLKLPAEMEEIPEYLCAYSTKLNSLTMPKKMKRIGKGAFLWCPVKNAVLPEGLESIGEKAFAFDLEQAEQGRKTTMSKMASLTIPASLKVIGKEAFAANNALTNIKFKKGSLLEEIGENAFAFCQNLTAIDLPDSLRKIGSGAFRQCKKMARVNLGRGVTELGDEVFLFCAKMTSLTANDSVKVIGRDILKNHGSKLKVTCPEKSEMYKYMTEFYPGIPLKLTQKK